MRYSKYFFLLILIISLTASCLDITNDKHVAYGDAIINVYQTADSINYNVQLFTYSWNKMRDVIAYTDAESTPIVLDSLNYQYTFSYNPKKASFSTSLPTASKYTFEIIFEDGGELLVVDYLDSVTINPPVISELKYDEEEKQIILEWDVVENAQFYKVILIDNENEIAFETELLEYTSNQIVINKYSYGWFTDKQPDGDTTFKVVIYAYLFEAIPSTFDIQCIAINDLHTVEWKE